MIVFWGECRKSYFEIKTYYAGYISDFLMSLIIFYGFFLTYVGGEKSYVLNFVYWFLLSGLISEGVISTSQEKQTGTINQLLLKPVSYFRILIYKNIFHLFFSLIQIVIILLITLNFFNFTESLNIYTITASILYFISLLGIGFIMTSLTLLNAKIGNFTSIISFLFLFTSGGVTNPSNLPKWIEIINKVQPLALIIKFNNSLLNQGIFLKEILVRLTIVSIVYYILGVFIYNKVYKYSKKNGISNKY